MVVANDNRYQVREKAQAWQETFFYPQASLDRDHQRKNPEEPDHRLPYRRDVDRIVHSKAYSRYWDKTQVVYLIENDHVTRRSLHVQLVSSFARGIAEVLRLNVDLVEAISLGHDVGHPPFGHEGESYLSALSEEHGNGAFAHPCQSCRLYSIIEPLNLGFAVYDGFLCHDGGMRDTRITPHFGKTWAQHEQELQQKVKDPDVNFTPATLEGCLVKLCDTISYVGRDIEDAIKLGIITREQVPRTRLGTTNKEILSAFAEDLIAVSYENDQLGITDEMYQLVKELRSFNFEHIYVHPKLKTESAKIKRGYRILFESFLDDLQRNRENSRVWCDLVDGKGANYIASTSDVQMVVDYIACMTDGYFVRTLQQVVVPARIEL